MHRFGLALGGGGVKGLAHIALLKKLDDLGVRPSVIVGTSIGAILGALYASGLSGREIETRVQTHLFSRDDGLKKTYQKRHRLAKWMKVFTFERERGGWLSANGLFEHLFTEIADIEFQQLDTPFKAIATDFHQGCEQVLAQGPLLQAVRASMAVPGVFAPVSIDGRVLVDGGLSNNVPCDHAREQLPRVIASDVICLPEHAQPNARQVLSGALNIMLCAAAAQRYQQAPPDYVFRPKTHSIDTFDFHRIPTALLRGEQAIGEDGAEIERVLGITPR